MKTADTRELLRDAPLKLIAARLRRARRDAGYSHDYVAERAGTSRQHLINLEKGRHRPRLDMLDSLARAYERPLDYFLVEEAGEPNPFQDEQAA